MYFEQASCLLVHIIYIWYTLAFCDCMNKYLVLGPCWQFVHVYVENYKFPNACNNESGFDVLWVLHSCQWQGLSLIGGACINIFGGSYEFKKETELCEHIYKIPVCKT